MIEGFSASVLKGELYGESLMINSIKGLEIAFLSKVPLHNYAHEGTWGPYIGTLRSDDGDINENVKKATCCNVTTRKCLI